MLDCLKGNSTDLTHLSVFTGEKRSIASFVVPLVMSLSGMTWYAKVKSLVLLYWLWSFVFKLQSNRKKQVICWVLILVWEQKKHKFTFTFLSKGTYSNPSEVDFIVQCRDSVPVGQFGRKNHSHCSFVVRSVATFYDNKTLALPEPQPPTNKVTHTLHAGCC